MGSHATRAGTGSHAEACWDDAGGVYRGSLAEPAEVPGKHPGGPEARRAHRQPAAGAKLTGPGRASGAEAAGQSCSQSPPSDLDAPKLSPGDRGIARHADHKDEARFLQGAKLPTGRL